MPELCTLTIGLEKQNFEVSKADLAEKSSTFYQMFFGKKSQNSIYLPDIHPKAFNMFLEYSKLGKLKGIEDCISHFQVSRSCFCSQCQQILSFLANFHNLIHLSKTYLIIKFQFYLISLIENLTPTGRSTLFDVSIYAGVALAEAEHLVKIYEEKLKIVFRYHLENKFIYNLSAEGFCNVMNLFFNNALACSNANDSMKIVFESLEKYAKVHGLFADEDDRNYWTLEERVFKTEEMSLLKRSFCKFVFDERMKPEFFAHGPSTSSFLTHDVAVKLWKIFGNQLKNNISG